MNNEIGKPRSPFLNHLNEQYYKEFALASVPSIDTRLAIIPRYQKYVAITNRNNEALTLVGDKLLNHIKNVCGTLEVAAVLMRMTFMRA